MKLKTTTLLLLVNLLSIGTAYSGYVFNESFEDDGFRTKEKFKILWGSTQDPTGAEGKLTFKSYKDMFNSRYDSRIVGVEEIIDGKKVIHPTRNGQYSFRQEIFYKKDYTNQNGGTLLKPRTGFGTYLPKNQDGDGNFLSGQEYFLGGSIFIPKDFTDDSNVIKTGLIQLHRNNDPELPNLSTKGSRKTTNITGVDVAAGNLILYMQRIVKKSDGNYYVDHQEKKLPFGGGKVNKGEWIDWKIHVKLCDKSCGTKGFSKLYINDEEIFNLPGQNLIEHSSRHGAHLTYDLYNYAWVCQGEDRRDPLKCYNNQTGTKDTGNRFIYHDELKNYQVTNDTERNNGFAAVSPARKSRASSVQNLNYNAGYTNYLKNNIGNYYCAMAGQKLPLPFAHFGNTIRFNYTGFSGTMKAFDGTISTDPTPGTDPNPGPVPGPINGDTAQSHVELNGNVLTIKASGQGESHRLAGTLILDKAIGSSKIIENFYLSADEVPDLSTKNVDIYFNVGKDYTNYIKLDVTGVTSIKFNFDQAVTDLETAAFNNQPLTSNQKSTGTLIVREPPASESNPVYFKSFTNTANEFVVKAAGKVSSDQLIARGEINLASSITSAQIVLGSLGASPDGKYKGYARLKSGSSGKIVEYRLFSSGTNTSSFRIKSSPTATVDHILLNLNGSSILDEVVTTNPGTDDGASGDFTYFKNFVNSSKEYVVKLIGQNASDELVAKGTITLSSSINASQLVANGLGTSADGKFKGYLNIRSGSNGKIVDFRIYTSGVDVNGFRITNSPSATLNLNTLNLDGKSILEDSLADSSANPSTDFDYFKNFLNSSKEYVVKLIGENSSDELVAKGTIALSSSINASQLVANGLGSSADGKFNGYLRIQSGSNGKIVEFRVYTSGSDTNGFRIKNSPSATVNLQTLNLNGNAIDG